MAKACTVFISSTSEDLKEYRAQAGAAAEALGFALVRMESFPASGNPTVEECLRRVADADVVVVIVAHRYGWVPDETDPKSITWLECEHAWRLGKEVLAFLVDPKYAWPAELKEDHRLVLTKNQPHEKRLAVMEEVARNERKLEEFKTTLRKNPVKFFTEAVGFRALVAETLSDWLLRHSGGETAAAPGDPDKYLRWLEDDTRQIRIRGLTSKRAEPYFFGIDEIYIELTTAAARDRAMEQHRVALEQALSDRNVVIVGEAGSGKSTFLRRTAFELCRALRNTRPAAASPFLKADDRRFPILIRIADLSRLLATEKSAKPSESPDWIAYFLGKQSEEYSWGVNEAFFRSRLKEGNCLVMVDGLDEAPDRWLRERIARLFEQATRAYSQCDFLVSTRPQSYLGDSVLEGFTKFLVDELEAEQIGEFFDHFARALALGEAQSKQFKDGLGEALTARREIRKMARNPLMLTALAVLQHNDQRLPEYRVDLYESILGWLAAARKDKDRRPPAENCLLRMRALALEMQNARGGRVVQMNKREAAELWAGAFGGTADQNEDLLEQETQDSGIISSAGADVRFWHLSFQEYLAAREIAGLDKDAQLALVVGSGNLYVPQWRETMRLLGGVLFRQGPAKVEGLFTAILGSLGPQPGLPAQARCFGLLGAMMTDLAPMGYQPKTEDYEHTKNAVMRIFEAGAAGTIDFKTRLEAAEALGQAGDPRIGRNNWVQIEGGTFLMGEAPGKKVTVGAFEIGRYPVTVMEYRQFVEDGGYQEERWWKAGGFGKRQEPGEWEDQKEHPNRPVQYVSWYEAAAYAAWAGVRLPREAEWEFAARGTEGREYPWGKEAPDATRANYYENGPHHPTPVGLYPAGATPEPEGIQDMAGNVWEWVDEWYDSRQEQRVLRGGSWLFDESYLRAAERLRFVPDLWDVFTGFRVAREVSFP